MARISVYIPDEIMEKLDGMKHRINISEVCREALDWRMATIGEWVEGLDTENLIPRLREEGAQVKGRWEELGRRNAAIWLDGASYPQVQEFAVSEPFSNMADFQLPRSAYLLMRLDIKESTENPRGDLEVAYKTAWLHHVSEVWQRLVAEPVQVEKPVPKVKSKPVGKAESL